MLKEYDLDVERFIEKPTTPIVPVDDIHKMYIVSHVPYPMYFAKLKENNYPNERIKAVVNAEEWNAYRKYFMKNWYEIQERVNTEKYKWMDSISEYQNILKDKEDEIIRLNKRIEELENKQRAINDILNHPNTDKNNEDKNKNNE